MLCFTSVIFIFITLITNQKQLQNILLYKTYKFYAKALEHEFDVLLSNNLKYSHSCRQLALSKSKPIFSHFTSQLSFSYFFANLWYLLIVIFFTAQRQLKLVDIFQTIDRDDSKTITRTELRQGLQVRLGL